MPRQRDLLHPCLCIGENMKIMSCQYMEPDANKEHTKQKTKRTRSAPAGKAPGSKVLLIEYGTFVLEFI